MIDIPVELNKTLLKLFNECECKHEYKAVIVVESISVFKTLLCILRDILYHRLNYVNFSSSFIDFSVSSITKAGYIRFHNGSYIQIVVKSDIEKLRGRKINAIYNMANNPIDFSDRILAEYEESDCDICSFDELNSFVMSLIINNHR